MASNDFATIAAATAAGYIYTASTMADGTTVKINLSKPVVGYASEAGGVLKAVGYSSAASAAGPIALNALNDQHPGCELVARSEGRICRHRHQRWL